MKTVVGTPAAFVGVCLGVLMLLIALSGNALAGEQYEYVELSRPRVAVIAHLSLSGTQTTQMLLQRESGREYLYLVGSSGTGFTIVDVTRPEKAIEVKTVTLPPGISAQGLDLIGNSLAITEESSTHPQSPSAHPESIQLFDVTDPTNPLVVKTFTGVTSLLTEEGRRLVYLTDDQGLWILRWSRKATLHRCTSSDAIAAFAECD